MCWFPGHEACGILAPQPGIELTPPALEGEVLTTGLPGKPQEWNSNTCYNMDESWKHYAKWNKPDTKDKYCMIALIRSI